MLYYIRGWLDNTNELHDILQNNWKIGLSVFLHKEMINVWGDGYVDYPDFIITQSMITHESKYHIVPHNFIQLLCVD